MITKADRILGCLLGGAAGDALGYPVEFYTERNITEDFGDDGITAFLTGQTPAVSDDTQMTAFTANSVLISAVCGGGQDQAAARFRRDLSASYREWYLTQTGERPGSGFRDWIMQEPRLFVRRAPGNTCMSACAGGAAGTPDNPINGSAGCGGVMRAAPVGLYFDPAQITMQTVVRLGAECGAVTHGHPRGWLPSAVLAGAVAQLTHAGGSITEAIRAAIAAAEAEFPGQKAAVLDLKGRLEQAEALAQSDTPVLEAIHALGEGWVGDEALAISACCAIRFEDDFAAGIIAAVNHRGDSDSTGAIAGNLLGARRGATGIPDKFRSGTDLHAVLVTLAEDLAAADDPSAPQLEKYRRA